MSERKLRRMSRTELIDVIDTLRQDETPQDTEALRRVDAERERLTERCCWPRCCCLCCRCRATA